MGIGQLKYLILLAGLLLTTNPVAQADPSKREVPESLVPILTSAEKALSQNQPKKALQHLATYQGPVDALHQLLVGHAKYAARDFAGAEQAYQRSVQLDPTLKPAGIGLARTLVEKEDWQSARDVLGRIVDVHQDSAAHLGLYARVAYELKDLRLASILVERGIVRFPKDRIFRKLDVAILLLRQDWTRASQGAYDLLAQNPNDPTAWRQLAAATQHTNDRIQRLAVVEAAALANSKDENLKRRHILEQYRAGHGHHALQQAEALLQRNTDPRNLELGIRIAEQAGNVERARAWLNRIPPKKRSRSLHILDARLAIQDQDPQKARTALSRLIDRGDASARVFVWAGQLAEAEGDMAMAESYFDRATRFQSVDRGAAVMHLAMLYHRLHQNERAVELLSVYTADHPGDRAAIKLLTLLQK